MADYWLGASTQTSVIICYRATANADITATVGDRTSSPVSADTTVRDGIVRLEVSRLNAGQDYDYEIFSNGTSVATGTCSTMPADGADYSICFLSCWRHDYTAGNWVYDAIAAHNPPVKVVIFQGDTPYIDQPITTETLHGIESLGLSDQLEARILATVGDPARATYDHTDPAEYALNLAAYHKVMRTFRNASGVRRIIRRYATLWQADDHEYPGGDITTEQFASGLLVNAKHDVATTQQQLDDVMALCQAGMAAYFTGNPGNSDANNDAGRDDADQLYYRHQVNDDLEIFCIECSAYKTSDADAATVRKIIGDTQRSWLETQVATSTATFKVISSPCGLSGFVWTTAANMQDSHPNIATGADTGERDVMMQALDDSTGVLFVCGDTHHSNKTEHNGITSVVASPIDNTRSQLGGGSEPAAYSDGRQWLRGGPTNGPEPEHGGQHMGQLGFVDISPSEMGVKIYQLRQGGERDMGTQAAGTNGLVVPARRLS